MENQLKDTKKLSFVQAMAWIVGSSFLVSVCCHHLFHHVVFPPPSKRAHHPETIQSIIQTSVQKEALKSEYLLELMRLSRNYPLLSKAFDPKVAEYLLLQSPLIQEAHVKMLGPSSVYVDYTVRQPIAWLSDYENIAMDKEGFIFPVYPFFSPKNLPEIIMGLPAFATRASLPQLPLATWNRPLQGKAVDLALEILQVVQPYTKELFFLRRIDVSKAFENSYGKREILLILDNAYTKKNDLQVIFPHIVRLSTQNYLQELGNYLALRAQLLEQTAKDLQVEEGVSSPYRVKAKIIDLRLEQLGFVSDGR